MLNYKSQITSHKRGFTPPRRRRAGFTLIEVLIVVSLLALIFIVGANLFFSTLKGASKAEIVKEIKQNGNFALGIMKRMIRNSREIDCSTPNQITITNPDQGQTTFRLDASNRIASESASGTQFLTSSQTPASSFSLSCSPVTSGAPTEVTLQFRLTQPGYLTRAEETAQVDFQTQVNTRNF